jgi:chromate transporter
MNHIVMTSADWLSLLVHYLLLSVLSVGGAITTAPDMHRFLVQEKMWLTDPQFSASVAIAQAAPGPNVLFVALLGWNVGINAGGVATACLGLVLAMVGILLPSATLTYLAAQWGHRNRELRGVRAFKQGMAPIVIALLVATGWVLATGAPATCRLAAVAGDRDHRGHRLAHPHPPAVAAGRRRAAGVVRPAVSAGSAQCGFSKNT